MTTALDIINSAAKKAGILFKSETLPADEANDGLDLLNDMIQNWSNDGLFTYTRSRETFNLTTGVNTYTIGTGGDFNTLRPFNIVTAYVRIATLDYPLEIIEDDIYERDISFKSLRTNYPGYLNYDGGYPLGTIRIFPAPAGSYELHLMTEKPLTTITSLTQVIDLPPGFNMAIKYGLAVLMAGEYGQEANATVQRTASSSLAEIKRNINVLRPVAPRKQVSRIYNILADR